VVGCSCQVAAARCSARNVLQHQNGGTDRDRLNHRLCICPKTGSSRLMWNNNTGRRDSHEKNIIVRDIVNC
jgi:hypothetical protein